MKPLKPGHFVTIGTYVYRAKKRTDGCKGCDLDDIALCPCVVDYRGKKEMNCSLWDIILKRIS